MVGFGGKEGWRKNSWILGLLLSFGYAIIISVFAAWCVSGGAGPGWSCFCEVCPFAFVVMDGRGAVARRWAGCLCPLCGGVFGVYV